MTKAPRLRGFHPRQLVYVLAVVLALLVVRDVFFPSGFRRTGEVATLFIRPGATIDDIARDLVQAGLLKSPFAFSILARATATDRQLKAGQYTFHRGDSVLVDPDDAGARHERPEPGDHPRGADGARPRAAVRGAAGDRSRALPRRGRRLGAARRVRVPGPDARGLPVPRDLRVPADHLGRDDRAHAWPGRPRGCWPRSWPAAGRSPSSSRRTRSSPWPRSSRPRRCSPRSGRGSRRST